jgi:hypothetical protein
MYQPRPRFREEIALTYIVSNAWNYSDPDFVGPDREMRVACDEKVME